MLKANVNFRGDGLSNLVVIECEKLKEVRKYLSKSIVEDFEKEAKQQENTYNCEIDIATICYYFVNSDDIDRIKEDITELACWFKDWCEKLYQSAILQQARLGSLPKDIDEIINDVNNDC